MIKYVLLDIDDTLLSFGNAAAAAIKKTFDRIGVPSTPEVIALYSRIHDEHWAMLERGELTQEQADYIGVPVEGPYKPDFYRY